MPWRRDLVCFRQILSFLEECPPQPAFPGSEQGPLDVRGVVSDAPDAFPSGSVAIGVLLGGALVTLRDAFALGDLG